MNMILAGIAGLGMGLAQPALSQTAPQPTPAATPAAAATDRNDAGKLQCRKQQVSGVLPRYKKVCKTKAEWDAEDKQAGADIC